MTNAMPRPRPTQRIANDGLRPAPPPVQYSLPLRLTFGQPSLGNPHAWHLASPPSSEMPDKTSFPWSVWTTAAFMRYRAPRLLPLAKRAAFSAFSSTSRAATASAALIRVSMALSGPPSHRCSAASAADSLFSTFFSRSCWQISRVRNREFI